MKVQKPRVKCEKLTIDTIVRDTGMSRNSVFQALSFFNNSERGRAVRAYALNNGGEVIMEEVIV